MLRGRYIPLLAVAAGLAVPAGASLHAGTALACTKAKIGGATKCLQRGQFCSPSYKRQYPPYGFHCVNRRLR